MSIIPVSSLYSGDLSRLGNNVGNGPRDVARSERVRRVRRQIAAVNRSLALHGERIMELTVPATAAR